VALGAAEVVENYHPSRQIAQSLDGDNRVFG
jgi:hypothetical protein